jgi:hypothetical protein
MKTQFLTINDLGAYKESYALSNYLWGILNECVDWNNKCYDRKIISKEQYIHIRRKLESLPREINQLIKYTNLKLKY